MIDADISNVAPKGITFTAPQVQGTIRLQNEYRDETARAEFTQPSMNNVPG